MTALQNEIKDLKEAVGQATLGLRLYQSKEDVVAQIRHRFTYVLVIVAVLSFFGIQGIAYVIIDQQWGSKLDDRVTKATVAVAQAETATEQAKDAAAKAKEITDIARGKAEAVTDKLEKITLQISDVDKKLENDMRAATDNVRELATKTAATIQKQLKGVEDQVAKLSTRAGVSSTGFKKQQQTLRQTYGSTKKSLCNKLVI